jgi:Ca2+-binding RTX toxin-like protein
MRTPKGCNKMSNTVHISANADPDLAAIINAALADPNVSTVVLGPGVFVLNSSIIVPSNKALMGSGRDDTIIRASDDFVWPSVQQNAVIVSESYSSNIALSDFSVDANRVSPDGLRLNGVMMRFTQNFLVERVDVANATGYAHYAIGDLGTYQIGGTLSLPVSGRYEDCNTYNSQIHFEQYFADGITLFNVHARDGDGDISTEAYFHPIVGSRNITYEQCSAIGGGFLGFSLISSLLPLENIWIIDTQIEIMHPSQGSALIALGGLPVNGLYIENSSFIAQEYIAFRIGGVTGTAENSYFQGGLFGLEVTTSGDGTPSQFVVTDSVALGVRDATSGVGVAGVHSDEASYLAWNGGVIEARAAMGLMFPVSGAASISATTQLIAIGHDLTVGYTEGGSDALLFVGTNFDLTGAPNLTGAVLQVDYLSHFSAFDSLAVATIGPVGLSGGNVLYNNAVIGTVSGGAAGSALRITLNASATPAMVETLLDNVYFRNTSQAPLTIARMMVAGLQIAGGSYSEITASLGVTGVDDAAMAVGDIGTLSESATLAINVLSNEADIDGMMDVVSMINDIAVAAGATVVLASGARVTLSADGQLLYDPNGVFSGLSDAAAGGNFTSADDSFSYTLSGGSAAQVDVVITGETSVDDVVRGDANANTLMAVLFGQTLKGQAGSDILDDNGFGATLNGGADNDTYRISNTETVIQENGDQGRDQVRTSLSSFTLTEFVESLFYTGTNDRFYGYGNASGNVIEGGGLGDFLIGYSGADTLRGGAGADVLDGGADHDVLDGGTGNDVMIGGAGNDVFYVDSVTDTIVEGDDPGFDTVFASISNYTLADWVENLSFAGASAYVGIGNAVGNQIMGSVSGDNLSGLGGNDRLIGFGGNDALNGGDGNDLLQGGIGSDQLSGGLGADQFRFDTSISYGDTDIISDFEFGVDQVQLSQTVFSALNLGALSATAFVSGTAAQDGDDRIIYDATTGSLYYDADGNGAGAAVRFASVAPQMPIDESVFVII